MLPSIASEASSDEPRVPVSDVPTYRTSVGMRGGYDLMGGLQFSLLLALGLREQHTLCDVGCGSLRAGRLFIPYLSAGNYYGVEPAKWKVEEGLRHEVGRDMVENRRPTLDYFDDFGLERFGTQFDYVLAQSVFSHTYRDLAVAGLQAVKSSLASQGLLVATFYETIPVFLPKGVSHGPEEGTGFRRSLCVAYTWREWAGLLHEVGLVGRRFRWRHKRQTWFVATHIGEEARLKETAGHAMSQLRGPGPLADAKRRALRRLSRSAE